MKILVIHVVKQGDTVYKIAREHGTTERRIIEDNAIKNPRDLVIGQALIVQTPKTIYTVKAGDTPTSIAITFGITPMTLLQNNPELIGQPYLRVGQNLVIEFEGEKRGDIKINAYAYPHINRNTLIHTLPYLTYLTIFSYGFKENGELTTIDDQPLINLAYQYETAPVMMISTIIEDGGFSGDHATALFNSEAAQDRLLDNIISTMQQKGYLGLDVDFEYLKPSDREAYQRFLEKVTQKLHPYGYFVNVALAPKVSANQQGLLYEAHDYKAIGAIADTVLIMTYEWGYTYGPPMAVAPLDQVRRVVSYAVSEIPPQKIFMGIPNYGYDWALPYERGVTVATAIGNERAIEIAMQHGVPVRFDETAQSPYFEYYSSDGKKHIVWFEDVRSIKGKLDLIDEFSLLGAGYWNAMRPFTQNWALVNALYDITKVV